MTIGDYYKKGYKIIEEYVQSQEDWDMQFFTEGDVFIVGGDALYWATKGNSILVRIIENFQDDIDYGVEIFISPHLGDFRVFSKNLDETNSSSLFVESDYESSVIDEEEFADLVNGVIVEAF